MRSTRAYLFKLSSRAGAHKEKAKKEARKGRKYAPFKPAKTRKIRIKTKHRFFKHKNPFKDGAKIKSLPQFVNEFFLNPYKKISSLYNRHPKHGKGLD